MSGPKSEGGWSPRISVQDISAQLAVTLGQEKSVEAVDAAAKALGYAGPLFERHEADAILDHLSRSAGLVGVAARSALRQSASAPNPSVSSTPNPRYDD